MPKQNLKLKLFFLTIIFCGFFGLTKKASAGTAYYVDPTAGGGGNGSYASPWNSLSQVNEHSFSAGDDVYFKANTTLNVPAGEYLDIDWNGTSGDWVIIGAYYGENQFGLNGGARPILEGNGTAPTHGTYFGMIHKQNSSHTDAYVEVKDLRVNNSGEAGIILFYINYGKVTNCYVYRDRWGNGIMAARSNNVIIDGNTVEESNYSTTDATYWGSAICVTSSRELGSSNNSEVTNNTVFRSKGEGIDILHGAENVLVSGNVVYDNYSVDIYVDSSRYVEVTNNIMYESSSHPFTRPNFGVMVENEAYSALCYANDIDIHHNYIANINVGLALASELQPCTVNNVKFYNNILADNDYNFIDWGANFSGWTGNEYYYNVSYTSNNSTMTHLSSYSPINLTYGANIFDDDVEGNAAVEACTVASPLEKTTGWDSLNAGEVTVSDFDLSSNGLAGRTACFGGDTTPPSAPSGLSVD